MGFNNQTYGSQFERLLFSYSKLLNMPMRVSALDNFPPLNIGRMDGASAFYVRKQVTSGQPISDVPTGNNTIRGNVTGSIKEDVYGVLKFTASMVIPYEAVSIYEKAIDVNPQLAVEPFSLQYQAVQRALTNICEKFAWQGLYSGVVNTAPVSGFTTSPNTVDSGQKIDFSTAKAIEIYELLANVTAQVKATAVFNSGVKDIVIAYPSAMAGILNQYIAIGSTPIARTLKTALLEDAGVDRLLMVRDDYLKLRNGNLGWLVLAVDEECCGLGFDQAIVNKGAESVGSIINGDHLGRILLNKTVLDETNSKLVNDGMNPYNLIVPNSSPLITTNDGFSASFWISFAGGIVPYEGYAMSINTSIKATDSTFKLKTIDQNGSESIVNSRIQQEETSPVEISYNSNIVNEKLINKK